MKCSDFNDHGGKMLQRGRLRVNSKELTKRYGKGYDRSNLYHCLKFYKTFPEIVDTACRQSAALLSWSHYRTLLQVKDPEARAWYEKEVAEQTGVEFTISFFGTLIYCG